MGILGLCETQWEGTEFNSDDGRVIYGTCEKSGKNKVTLVLNQKLSNETLSSYRVND